MNSESTHLTLLTFDLSHSYPETLTIYISFHFYSPILSTCEAKGYMEVH